MSLEGYLGAQLEVLKAKGLFRDPEDAGARQRVQAQAARLGVRFIDVSSNDYLGFAAGSGSGSVSRETPRGSPGAGASRLVQGTHPEHEALERELAEWVGLPSALLFSSGFAANLGVMSALAGAESVVISDALNHASLVDGCRLSRAQVTVVPHRNLSATEAALAAHRGAAARWLVTESYFSMDGDAPDLEALRALCDRYRAFLVVDEAHALGVFGPAGGGRCLQTGIRPDVLVGGLGKAVGSQGGFVAGSQTLRAFLWNRARSFVFSTAPSPNMSERTREHVRAVRAAEPARARLAQLSRALRVALQAHGLPSVPDSEGPIVPLFAGPGDRVLELAERLREEGILAQAIRPPTVPEGFARLRLTLNTRTSEEDIERLVGALDRAWKSTP